VRSDSLPQLLSFAGSIPGLAPLLKDIVQIGVVLDAQIVQQELRWRVRRRKKPDARTGLHEAIASGVIVPFAPTFLDSEIEQHLADIAEWTSVGVEDVRREWQDFRKSLHFYSPKQQPKLTGAEIVDADDLEKKWSGREDLNLRPLRARARKQKNVPNQREGTGVRLLNDWSGREDLNLRPPGPEPGALPG